MEVVLQRAVVPRLRRGAYDRLVLRSGWRMQAEAEHTSTRSANWSGCKPSIPRPCHHHLACVRRDSWMAAAARPREETMLEDHPSETTRGPRLAGLVSRGSIHQAPPRRSGEEAGTGQGLLARAAAKKLASSGERRVGSERRRLAGLDCGNGVVRGGSWASRAGG